MTTKPVSKKYRIRSASPLARAAAAMADESQPTSQAQNPAASTDTTAASVKRETAPHSKGDNAPTAASRTAPTSDGFGERSYPGSTLHEDAKLDDGQARGTANPVTEEAPTGRQLRMARRLAQKHGIEVSSDQDAVKKLRAQGIDPFERAAMLELVVPETTKPRAPARSDAGDRVQLPQKADTETVPSTETRPRLRPQHAASNTAQIREIQRDIARRRRRKLALLATRLLLFVGLPTLIAGYYFYVVATPMYATRAEFVIQQAEANAGGGLGGLFSGTGFATSQDSIAVQSYLTSRDAMIRLDEDAGFIEHFSQPFIDPIRRLPDAATMERAYDLYQSVLKIGYDPTEGIVKMEVVAADPMISVEYATLLIGYAEERVDNLTQRLRGDQMADARASFDEAETKMLGAQERVLELQERLGVLDPAAESGSVMGQITTFETQLRQKQLERQSILSNRRPNEARLNGVEADIERLRAIVAELRAQMTDGSGDAASLARVSAELRIAETDLQTRTALMQQALQQLETARIEANRQTRYLSLGVTPVPPDEPSYPRSFENTLLSFLVLAGLYLLLSLTASILREQVSG